MQSGPYLLYLDTSALVKLYVEEAGSDIVEDAVGAAMVVYTSEIADLEARVSLERIRHEGKIETDEELERVLSSLEENFGDGGFEIVPYGKELASRAGELARKHPLIRAYDALHLASALTPFEDTRTTSLPFVLPDQHFLAFDRGFVRVARRELTLYFDPFPEQAKEEEAND